jgi:hypothetical protein
MGFELFYSWQMMVLTFFKKTHDTPWRFVRKSNMLIFPSFMKSLKCPKQHGYYLPIRPLDFKTSLSKKIGFRSGQCN